MQSVTPPPKGNLHRHPSGRWPWSRVIRMVPVLGLVGLAGHPAVADTTAETLKGIPVLPVPMFEETGLPTFTMPVGATALSTDMPAGGDGSAASGSTGGGSGATSATGNGDSIGSAAASWTQYAGQNVGSGQCVALVQAADSSVGLTKTWAEGAQVQGNTQIQPGTAIATFDNSGRYANATDGSSHAAIYLGQNAQGIQVMDQWSDHAASYRTISWTNPGATAANTGSQFYVVSHAS